MAVFNNKARRRPTGQLEKPSYSASEIGNSIEDTNDALFPPKKDILADYNATSKFAEAMKNPDWRRRRESNVSSTSAHTKLGNPALQKSRIVTGLGENHSNYTPTNREATEKSASEHAAIHEHSELNHDTSDANGELKDDIESSAAIGLKNLQGGALCALLNQKVIPNYQTDDRQMRIIEIMPLGAGGDMADWKDEKSSQSPKFAHIKEIGDEKKLWFNVPRKTSPSEEKNILSAILAIAEETPPRLRLPSSKSIGHGQSLRKDASTIETRRNVKRMQRKENVKAGAGTSLPYIQPQNIQATSSSTPTGSHQDDAELQKKNTAFKKFLQKLQKKTGHAHRCP